MKKIHLLLLFLMASLVTKGASLTIQYPSPAYSCEPQDFQITSDISVPAGAFLKISLLNGEVLNSSTGWIRYNDAINPNIYYFQSTLVNALDLEIIFPCQSLSSGSSTAPQSDILDFELGTPTTFGQTVTAFVSMPWILNSHPLRLGSGSTASTLQSVNSLTVDLYFAKLEKDLSFNSNVSVDYIDSYDSNSPNVPKPITRSLKYINFGPTSPGPDPLQIPLHIKFYDSFNCTSLNMININSVVINHMRHVGNADVIVNSYPVPQDLNANPYIYDGDEIFISDFDHDDWLVVIETLTFPSYQSHCITFCNNLLLQSQLNYGCTTNCVGCQLNMCNAASGTDNVGLGPKEADIKIWRLEPDPIANSIVGTNLPQAQTSHAIWQYGLGNQTSTHWSFIIENKGEDVAKNPLLQLFDTYFSNFYYILNASNIVCTPPLISQTVQTRTVNPLSCLACSTAVKSVSGTIGHPLTDQFGNTTYILAPHESVKVEFDLYYECPQNDNNLFQLDKVLNDWDLNTEYKDECNSSNQYYSSIGQYLDASDQNNPYGQNLYELDPYSTTISTNRHEASHLYLHQDYSPNTISLAAAQNKDFGLYSTFTAHNFEFCRTPGHVNLFTEANLISDKLDFTNPDNMTLYGGIRFVVDADELLDVANIQLTYNDINGAHSWPAAGVGTIGTYQCSTGNLYYADFMFVDCPNGNNLAAVYEILNNSDFKFDMRAACEPAGCPLPSSNVSHNPDYRIKTYLIINDLPNSNFHLVPMAEKEGNIVINCPGCRIPGITVESSSKVLDRTTFGLVDDDNDGLADLTLGNSGSPIQISSTQAPPYNHMNDLEISHSIVGDELEIRANATVNDGSDETFLTLGTRPIVPTTLARPFSGPIHLTHFYSEFYIENSNSSKFDVEPTNLVININAGTPQAQTINLNPATWTNVVYDQRNDSYGGGYLDIVFVDLSATGLNTLLGQNYFVNDEFSGNQTISLIMSFKQNNNYSGSYGSFATSDNRFMSRVNLNMYLTGEQLVGQGVPNPIYDAFEHHLRFIAQDKFVLGPDQLYLISNDMLYFCQTFSKYHYFYSIAANLYSTIVDANLVSPQFNDKCFKSLALQRTYSIGGELSNVFPFEFRKIPEISNIHFIIPGNVADYNFHPIDFTNTSNRSSFKVYPSLVCSQLNNFNSTLIAGANPFPAVNLIQNQGNVDGSLTGFPSVLADESINITACNTPIPNSSSFIYGDEYLQEQFSFPFELTSCQTVPGVNYQLNQNFTTDILNVPNSQSIPFVSNNTYGLKISTKNNSITPTTSLASPPGTQTLKFYLQVKDPINTDDNIQNAFIYFDEPAGVNLFSSATVTGGGLVNQPMSRSGNTNRWFVSIGNIHPPYDITFEIDAVIATCYSNANNLFNMNVFVGYSCDPNPNILPSNFCYEVNTVLGIGLPSDNVNLFGQPISYQLCQPVDEVYTFHTSGTDILNLNFILQINDNTLQNLSYDLIYQENTFTQPCVISSAVPISSSQTNISLPLNNQCFNGLVKKGGDVHLTIHFTPISIYNGNPFDLNYTYTNYCGTISNPILVPIGPQTYSNIGQNCPATVTIIPNTTVCSGSTVVLSTIITNSTSAVSSYSWIKNSTTQISTGPTANATGNSNDIFTVTVTFVGGLTITATSPVIFSALSNCCYPQNFVNGVDLDFSNKYSSQLPFVVYNTNAKIVINGVLTIDQDLTFNNCSNIIMGPGATIHVLTNRTLTLGGNSHLYACDALWSGIKVDAKGTVDISESLIEDAVIAVDLSKQANVISRLGTRFWNNVIGINAQVSSAGINTIGFNVDDTYFETKRALRSAYPGQVNWLPGSIGYAGLRFGNLTNVSVGSGIPNKIHFKHLNFGIFATQTNLNVSNCKFIDLTTYDASYPRGKWGGTGIYCESRVTPRMLVQHGDDNKFNYDFERCLYGIKGVTTSMDISGNQMYNVDYGISNVYTKFGTIDIDKNYISCNQVGISLLLNDYVSQVHITDNKIDAGERNLALDGTSSGSTGIDIADQARPGASPLKFITDNQINLFNKGMIGINLNSVLYYQVKNNFVELVGNTVNLNMIGIGLQNSSRNTISCNGILGDRVSQASYSDEEAIDISNSNENLYSQNSMTSTSNGIRFRGSCISNGGNPTSLIQKNRFYNHFYGLRYDVGAQVEEQDLSGNQWRVIPAAGQIAAYNQNTNPADIAFSLYKVGATNFCMPPNFQPTTWFQSDPGVDLEIRESDCDQLPIVIAGSGSFAKLLNLIADTLNASDYRKAQSWQMQVQLFQYLLEDSSLITNSNDLSDFYISTAATNIEYFAELKESELKILDGQNELINEIKQRSAEIYFKSILLRQCDSLLISPSLGESRIDSIVNESNDLMTELDYLVMSNEFSMSALNASISNNIDLLNSQNSEIIESEIFESNKTNVEGIYNSIALGRPIDSLISDYPSLVFIAGQCPLSGGPSVFLARSLLKLINPNSYYDDGLNCIQGGYVYRNRSEFLPILNVFPNPTSGLITVTYNLDNDAILQISDMLGRPCISQPLQTASNAIDLDLSRLENGVYYYQVIGSNGKYIFNGKVILEK